MYTLITKKYRIIYKKISQSKSDTVKFKFKTKPESVEFG